MSSPRWNIAVIGAGPAGSVAAIKLAQFGHRVTLFEKAKFPRDKVCGECLSATGITVLQRIGVAARIAELEPSRLRRATAIASHGAASSVTLPDDMWGLTRRAMDAALLQCASDAGVELRIEAATFAGEPSSRAVHLPPLVETQLGGLRHFDAVVLADGKGASISHGQPTGDFGIKAHFRDVNAERDTIELHALTGGGYAGLAPVNDDLWNAAWSVPGPLLKRHKGNIDALFDEAVWRSRHLRRRFVRAKRVSDWLSCPLPRYAVRRDWPRNVIPIGNAAAALEPVGGEGMGLAMRSAELAAEAIDVAARQNRDVDAGALRKSFDRLWRRRSAACRGAAIALSHPIAGPLAVEIAARSRGFARIGLALMGK